MSYYFTDKEIEDFILEEKPFPDTIDKFLNFKESDGHKRASVTIDRPDGSQYNINLRQNVNNVNDFSVIIAYQCKGNNKDFKLRRYNGKSHEHSNKIEKSRFYNFHIHISTERYQKIGAKEESFAEETSRYTNLNEALECMIKDCNIKVKINPQMSIFDQEDK